MLLTQCMLTLHPLRCSERGHFGAASRCAQEFPQKEKNGAKLTKLFHEDTLSIDSSLSADFPSLTSRVSPARVSDVGALANTPEADTAAPAAAAANREGFSAAARSKRPWKRLGCFRSSRPAC